ncbi:MAG: ATP synthase F1, epsilon subunit [uncultured bacterium (gcode 4)]|uniref:ATP synthase F1, epsilon subunit n=1 Tax=uncultured bacterium (gcode 4) TaxID=1234023 RepID=K2G6I2_9BACT|nr:MAG: ATP synthase F1, epsilon subunit [uncultured bacterium (gcode 4)]
MKLTLTSIKKRILEIDDFKSITIPTKSWEITILDNHEPLISALKPWIMTIRYDSREELFAIGWWVLETDWLSLSIVADMVEDWAWLDIEAIKRKKDEAKKLMEKYREENKNMNMDYYIELETQFLKESALEQLAIR